MNRKQRRAEVSQERKKDPEVYRRACVRLQHQHGMTLDRACEVVRSMDRQSTGEFTPEEEQGSMIVIAAWQAGLISEELAEELLGQKAFQDGL